MAGRGIGSRVFGVLLLLLLKIVAFTVCLYTSEGQKEDNSCSDVLEYMRGVRFGTQVENLTLDLNMHIHPR